MSLSFSVLNQPIGRKIYLMMQQAFDGRPDDVMAHGVRGADDSPGPGSRLQPAATWKRARLQ